MTAADKATLSELHDLLDLVQTDGSIHDLDQQEPQTVLGQVLLGLMRRLDFAEEQLYGG